MTSSFDRFKGFLAPQRRLIHLFSKLLFSLSAISPFLSLTPLHSAREACWSAPSSPDDSLYELWDDSLNAIVSMEPQDRESLKTLSTLLSCIDLLGVQAEEEEWLMKISSIDSPRRSLASLQCSHLALNLLASKGSSQAHMHLLQHARSSYSPFRLIALDLLHSNSWFAHSRESFETACALYERLPPALKPSGVLLLLCYPYTWNAPLLKQTLFAGSSKEQLALLHGMILHQNGFALRELEQAAAKQFERTSPQLVAQMLQLISHKGRLDGELQSFLIKQEQHKDPSLALFASFLLYLHHPNALHASIWAKKIDACTPALARASLFLYSDRLGKKPPQTLLNALYQEDPTREDQSDLKASKFEYACIQAAQREETGLLHLIEALKNPPALKWEYYGLFPRWSFEGADRKSSSLIPRTMTLLGVIKRYLSRLDQPSPRLIEEIHHLATSSNVTHHFLGVELGTLLPLANKHALLKQWSTRPGQPLLRLYAKSSLMREAPSSEGIEALKEDLLHLELPPLELPILVPTQSFETAQEKKHLLQVQWEWAIFSQALETVRRIDPQAGAFTKRLFFATTSRSKRLFLSKFARKLLTDQSSLRSNRSISSSRSP